MKRILLIVVLAVILLTVVGYVVGNIQRERYLAGVERVVVINLQGPIEEAGAFFMGPSITPQAVYNRLRRVEEERSIKAAVVRINTPGGSVAASQEIADMFRNFDKPLVVSMGDMAASGGYYISAPADGIVAQPGTMTGSIGVILTTVNPEGLYDMLGLEVEVIKSGEHKDLFQRRLTEEERGLLKALSDEAYDQFVDEIAVSRGIDREEVLQVATGELFMGTQARDLGLVDRLGGVDAAVEYAAELGELEDPVRYELPSPGLLSQLSPLGSGISSLVKRLILPDELSILEGVRGNFPMELRYELRR